MSKHSRKMRAMARGKRKCSRCGKLLWGEKLLADEVCVYCAGRAIAIDFKDEREADRDEKAAHRRHRQLRRRR